MAFKNDTKGMGGQRQILSLMQNHYSALVNIKPTIDSRKPPPLHITKKRPMSAKPKTLEEKLYSAPEF